MSGLVPDSRTLVDHGRVDAQNYTFTYDEAIPVESVTQSICDLSIRFGEDRGEEGVMSRPFGVALLIGGVDQRGPVLFHTDPAGNYTQYLAKAIGTGSDTAQTALEAQYYKSISLQDAQILVLSVLRQVMEEKLTQSNVELSVVTTATKKLTHLKQTEIEVRHNKPNFNAKVNLLLCPFRCASPSLNSYLTHPHCCFLHSFF